MLSGGSLASWSVTCAAKTVTVQASPNWKSLAGLTVKVVGPPVTTVSATFFVPEVQTIWNQLPATFTGSEKVIVRLVVLDCWMAVSVGVVAVTDGGESVVKLNTWSAAMLSGGSLASTSVT